jgi:hypothetical protein
MCGSIPPLVHQPAQHLGRTIGAVGGKPLLIKAEEILGAFDHGSRCADLGLSDRPARFDVNDDGIVHVDQIVGGVSEEGMAVGFRAELSRFFHREVSHL